MNLIEKCGLCEELDKLIETYREKVLANTPTSDQLLALIQLFVTTVTNTVCRLPVPDVTTDRVFEEGVLVATSSEYIAKETVLSAFDKFYDTVVAPFDIPMIPEFIENTYIDPAVRTFVRSQAANTFDAVSSLLSWFVTSRVTTATGTAGEAFAVLQ